MQFYEAWTAAYAPVRPHYEAAAQQLHAGITGVSEPSQVFQVPCAEWFALRAFDVLLLREGGPMRK